MPTIVALADAVADELNAQQWSLPFIALRLYRPRFEPADLQSLQVSVVPRSIGIERLSRKGSRHEYQIDIAIQKQLDVEANSSIDGLMALVDEVVRYFPGRQLASTAICTKVENEPIYAIEHLDELRCFTSVIRLTFEDAA